MAEIKEKSSVKVFGGLQKVFTHQSDACKCEMTFAVYVPQTSKPCPVLYYLSGLTCTHENVVTKAGFQRYAAEHNVIVVTPDTSPRGVKVEGDDDSWDFGTGAGFYVDATEEKWKTNYNMYSYITSELPAIIDANFSTQEGCVSITGHSMGGHGALICALKNPGMYKSVSAFSPICHPSACPWGQKAFTGYLGPESAAWADYDATLLAAKYDGPSMSILIDVGKADSFYTGKQLLPEDFTDACLKAQLPVAVRMHEGYDHSYYFIASFMEDHFRHHIEILAQK
eukprot:m.88747 g.88747  ORF g.88747 m.88747 type:complete len:283 (+) comp26232_c0_seq1:304-1152(+)